MTYTDDDLSIVTSLLPSVVMTVEVVLDEVLVTLDKPSTPVFCSPTDLKIPEYFALHTS